MFCDAHLCAVGKWYVDHIAVWSDIKEYGAVCFKIELEQRPSWFVQQYRFVG